MRSLFPILGGLLLGIILRNRLPLLDTTSMFLGIVVLIFLSSVSRSPHRKGLALVALMVLVGFIRTPAHTVPSTQPQGRVVLVGTVISELQVHPTTSVSAVVRADSILEGPETGVRPGDILQVWYTPSRPSLSPSTITETLHFGSRFKITGHLHKPISATNPGQYPADAALKRQGIRWRMEAVDFKPLGAGNVSLLARVSFGLRHKMRSSLERMLPSDLVPWYSGLILGDKSSLERSDREDLVQSGLGHLLAVSGLHVGFVATAASWVLLRLKISGSLRVALQIATLLAYALMTGLTPSVSRASIMISLSMLGGERGRPQGGMIGLALAACIILLASPLTLFEPGFQLSFAATWGILRHGPWIRHQQAGVIRQGFKASLVALAYTWPLTAYWFSRATLASLITNPLMVPLAALMVVYGFSAAAIGAFIPKTSSISAPVAVVVGRAFVWLARLNASAFGWATVHAPALPWTALAAYYAFLLSIPGKGLFKFQRVWKTASLALAAMLIWAAVAGGPAGVLEVTFLDVRQGDAIVVSLPRTHTAIVDCGPGPGVRDAQAHYDAGQRVVVPFLQRRLHTRIHRLFLTHGHLDHIGGARSILGRFPTGEVIVPNLYRPERQGQGIWLEELQYIASFEGIPLRTVQRGDTLEPVYGLNTYVLGPPEPPFYGTDSDENNNSLIILFTFGSTGFLMMADIETQGEASLLNWLQQPAGEGARIRDILASLEHLVLKVAHHGSPTSTSQALLDFLKPSLAVISVGPNTFGHPCQHLILRMKEMGIPVFRTDSNGAISVLTDGKSVWVRTFLGNPESTNEDVNADPLEETVPHGPIPVLRHILRPQGAVAAPSLNRES